MFFELCTAMKCFYAKDTPPRAIFLPVEITRPHVTRRSAIRKVAALVDVALASSSAEQVWRRSGLILCWAGVKCACDLSGMRKACELGFGPDRTETEDTANSIRPRMSVRMRIGLSPVPVYKAARRHPK